MKSRLLKRCRGVTVEFLDRCLMLGFFSWSVEICIVFHYFAQTMSCSLTHKQNVSLSGIIPLDILIYFWKGWKITNQFYKLQCFIRAAFHIYAFMTVIQIQLLKALFDSQISFYSLNYWKSSAIPASFILFFINLFVAKFLFPFVFL